MNENNTEVKSERALREERVLQFWKENKIFEKTVEKKSPKGDFVFYEGPPTANAKPALHHFEARAFKDAIPRYKTMRGFHVPRRAGWDTHGLPVELQIEKKLGLTSKKDIEAYGVEKFNQDCKQSVFDYISDWEKFTERMAYWVDFDEAYYTFNNSYIEALWSVLAKVEEGGLLYKDYKVLPWCPRCGTALSSHELAQGYQDVKDLSVYAKFPIMGFEKAYFLAWTTTPWTLAGNVALAVGADIDYVEAKVGEEILVLAKERLSVLTEPYEIIATHKGSEMVGMAYEPLYPFLKDSYKGEGLEKAFKVYTADFVTTTDGTGIVHTAVMYGQDDFVLGTSLGLPKYHTVDDTGHFKEGNGFLTGRFVKDEETAVEVIKDLAHRGLLFKKEKYEHSYPHCWRCKTPLIYYARDSWYIAMSKLRDELVKENEKINWEPEYIKEGRFGEWLREIKDWAISRERYWGTPLPVWVNADGTKRIVLDSLETLRKYSKKSDNKYFVMRHGGSEGNKSETVSYKNQAEDHLTEEGRAQAKTAAENLKDKNIDLLIVSPFARTRETAEIVRETLGLSESAVVFDERLVEINPGEFDGKNWNDYHEYVSTQTGRKWFEGKVPGGESLREVGKRTGECLYDLEVKYKGKNILLVTHGGAAWLSFVAAGLYQPENKQYRKADTHVFVDEFKRFDNAEVRELPFVPMPHNQDFMVDLHRPFIDEIVLEKDGEEYKRTKEVMDVWFDSGAMPFAQDPENVIFPADYISEAIDQTRGWFYTLHAIGVLMGKGAAFRNVICLGHLLDKDGKKMSKSVGNIVEPWTVMNRYGVDALRLWMYSVNQPGDSKNFDERIVDELAKKNFTRLENILSFYELNKENAPKDKSFLGFTYHSGKVHLLDHWLELRTSRLLKEVTDGFENYDLFAASRPIMAFIDDLSTWYLRRSRTRPEALPHLCATLKTLAITMAPLTPYMAEEVYQRVKEEGDKESVHLEDWVDKFAPDADGHPEVLERMGEARRVVSLALEARQKANIKVRQPLSKLEIKSDLPEEYLEILKDELNVKEVVVNKTLETEVLLDTTLTPELEEEGRVRDAIRAIQEWRKEQNLKPGEMARYEVPAELKELFVKYAEEIKKAATIEF